MLLCEGMRISKRAHLWVVVAALALAACGSGSEEGGDDDDDTVVETYSVDGTVVDFETATAISDQATISTANLTPPPTISISGASFTIEGVPPHSVFQALAGSPPNYRNTYSAAIEVLESDLSGVELTVVSEAYLADLVTAFGVTGTGGVLFARAVNADGSGRAGVEARAFEINGTQPVSGPYFLDADLQAAPALTETSSSGYAVFFEVAPGLTSITAATDSGYTMEMSSAPIANTTVTIADVIVTDGPAERPANVSFSADVRPIFQMRGCDACHSGNGIGRDLGNLTLDGSDNLIFRETTEELSPKHQVTRVNPAAPELSLLLTMPSAEDPPDVHPNVTFASPQDWDYLTILVWIEEGAKDN